MLEGFDAFELKISIHVVLSENKFPSRFSLLHLSYSNRLESDSEMVLIAFLSCYVEPYVINYVEMTSSHIFRIGCCWTITAFALLEFHPLLSILLNLPIKWTLCPQKRIRWLKLIVMACLIFKEVNCEVEVGHVSCLVVNYHERDVVVYDHLSPFLNHLVKFLLSHLGIRVEWVHLAILKCVHL